jgi:hypothetical protein
MAAILKKLLLLVVFLVTGVFVFMGLVPALSFLIPFDVLIFVLPLLGVPNNLIQAAGLWIVYSLSALTSGWLMWRVWPDKMQAK